MTGTNKTQKNWQNFIKDSKNKTGLFHFIADRIADMDTVDPVIVTREDLDLSNHEIRLDDISPSILPSLQELGLQKWWVAFGQGSHLIWIPIHDIVTTIALEKANGILFLHAFSGCVFNAFSVCEILYLQSLVEQSCLPGKRGTCVMRCLMSSHN